MGGQPIAEDSQDALLEGDRPVAVGSARAALANPTFRTIFFGAFASNIGSWMQNIVLGAFAYDLTKSSTFVAVLVFAQLGPLLLLSMVGGLIADTFDRRRLLIVISIEQLVFSVGLALVTAADNPSRVAMFLMVLAVGIGHSVYAPAYSGLLPSLLSRDQLAAAISLNSAQMNASRVIGPPIGAFLYDKFGAPWVFAGNAVTYVFVVLALMAVRLPARVPAPRRAESRWRSLTVGLRVARSDRVLSRALVTITVFSLLALTFVGQMPVVADQNLGLAPKSTGFGVLYAMFGIGALLGALSIGTVLADRDRANTVRAAMAGYALMLAVFAVTSRPAIAYVIIVVLGYFYFAMVTSLNTALQERLDDSVRGRVLALWIMGFGGTVGIGNLLVGPVIDAIGVTPVLLFGAAVAAALVWYADVRLPSGAPELVVAPAD